MVDERINWRLVVATLLHGLIFSLIFWWMIFAFSLIDRLEPSSHHRNMLYWEGATLLGLVVATAALTIYMFLQEKRQTIKLKEFLAGFTHDLKTSLARVRLQTESLSADNRDPAQRELFNRLITDTSRLETQVQNSLFVGATKQLALYSERYLFSSLMDLLKDSWPQVEIVWSVEGADQKAVSLNVDSRAIESVFNNLVHNSITHGEATRVQFRLRVQTPNEINVVVSDNGRGFQGDQARLGEVFFRHNKTSGSGLGLFTARSYVERMGGALSVISSEPPSLPGFAVSVILPGRIEAA